MGLLTMCLPAAVVVWLANEEHPESICRSTRDRDGRPVSHPPEPTSHSRCIRHSDAHATPDAHDAGEAAEG